MEREPQSNEALKPAVSAELEQLAERQSSPETTTENPEQTSERVETARAKVEEQAEVAAKTTESAHKPAASPTKLDRRMAYRQTVRSLQRQLPTASRAFSKVIHNPVIDRTSEAVGATVMRPSVSLGAGVTALVVGGFFYFTAKIHGFTLSGSEFLISLVIGGVLGLILELVWRALRRLTRRR